MPPTGSGTPFVLRPLPAGLPSHTIHLCLLLLTALVIRSLIALNADAVANDAAIFSFILDIWIQDGWSAAVLAHHQNPGYPAAIGLTQFALERVWSPADALQARLAAGQSVSVVAGTLTALWVYLLARRMGFRVGLSLSAAWVYALLPAPARFSADMLSDTLCWCIYLAGLLVLLDHLRSPIWWRVGLLGLLAAGAFYVRMEGIGLAVIAAAGCLLHGRRLGGWHRRVLKVVTLGLITGLLVAPYVWERGELFAKKSLVPEAIKTHADALNSSPTSLPPRYAALTSASASELFQRAGRFVTEFTDQLWRALHGVWLGLALFAAVVLGCWRRRHPPAWARGFRPVRVHPIAGRICLYAGGLQTAAMFRLMIGDGYIADRHVLLPAILMIPLAVLGGFCLLRRLGDGWTYARTRAFAVLLGLALVLLHVPWLVRPLNAGRAYIARAGEWIRANEADFGPGPALADRPWFAFYAGRAWQPTHPRDRPTPLGIHHLVEQAQTGHFSMLLLDPSFTLGRFPRSGGLRAESPDLLNQLPGDLFELVAKFPEQGDNPRLGGPARALHVYRIRQ